MTTVVQAPGDLIVATIDGVGVRLAGVEVTKAPLFVDIPPGTPCIVIYLSAARGYETVRHDAVIAQTWSLEDRAAEAEEAQKDGPPKLSNLNRVGITVTDDVGAGYGASGFRMVGDGIGWDDMRVFAPVPASTTAILHLDFAIDGKSTERRCEIALTAP